MKLIVILFSAFAMTASVAAQTAQDKKPDFSGRWIEASAAGAAQQGQRIQPGQRGQQQGQRQQVQRGVQQVQRGVQQAQRGVQRGNQQGQRGGQQQGQRAQQGRRGGRAPATLGSGWGKQFTITQLDQGLTVERVFFTRGDMQPALKYRYSLKGSETENTILMGRGYQDQVSKTAWDGDKLVLKTLYESQYPVDGQKVNCEVTQILSLLIDETAPDSPPSLVVETTRGGVLGGPPSTTRTVYSKN